MIKVVTNSGDCTVNTGENSISEPATVRRGKRALTADGAAESRALRTHRRSSVLVALFRTPLVLLFIYKGYKSTGVG